MLEKFKSFLSLDLLTAVITCLVVATSSCYFMLASERYETGNVVMAALLNICFIGFWLRSTSQSIQYDSQILKITFLLIQFICVVGLFFLVPYNYTAILITIWCTLLPTVMSVRKAMFSAPLWSSPLWLIYQFYWHEQYAFVSAVLFFMFNIFALIMVNTADKERLAKDHANQLNRELIATQNLLSQATKQDERIRIARNIHDLLGHHLTALTINLQVASRITDGEAKQKVDTCHSLAKLLLSDVREAVSEIREKSELDLEEAVLALFTNIPNIETNIYFAPDINITQVDTADTLLRCIQESLTNTLKHSNTSKIDLSLTKLQNNLRVNISDNGQQVKNVKLGNGLKGIQERVSKIGGQVTFNSNELGFHTQMTIPQATL